MIYAIFICVSSMGLCYIQNGLTNFPSLQSCESVLQQDLKLHSSDDNQHHYVGKLASDGSYFVCMSKPSWSEP